MSNAPEGHLVRAPEAGCAILVGEDNRTVARVIAKILEKEGHRVYMVNTGPIALDTLLVQSFDLVLLSANLPEMDPVEVTNLYRFGSVGRRRIPILGLMGDVNAKKLSDWVEAGLDGCIGKPIEPMELIEAVNAYLGRESRPQERPTRSVPLDSGQGPAIDMRELRDLEKLGGEDFVESVVTQFIADASRLLPELSACSEAEDTSLFRDHIHALRSCAGNVGAVALYKLCLASQTMAPHELVGDGGSYVARLKSEFERAVSALGEREWRDTAVFAQAG